MLILNHRMIVIPLLVPAKPSKAERVTNAPANNERTNDDGIVSLPLKITGSVILVEKADKAAGNAAFNFCLSF